MNKLLTKTIILFSFILAILIMAQTALAHPPTAVTLAEFDVIPLNNQVRIEWSTGSELNSAGYRIKRIDANGTEKFLENVGDNGFILGVGGVAVGGDYSEVDDQVQNGEVYTYVLIEVERSAQEIVIAQETVTVGIPSTAVGVSPTTAGTSPTNTPIVVSGGSSGVNKNTTATPTITPTASPTNPTTTPDATVVPTNTPSNRTIIATITPRPDTNENDDVSNENSNTNKPSNLDPELIAAKESNEDTTAGVSVVFAEEESLETLTIASQIEVESSEQNQDDYPDAQPTTTAVIPTDENYPENAEIGTYDATEATFTPVPIIGSKQSYEDPQANEPSTIGTNGNSSTAATQSRVYLWLGFIIALLIFITGLIGSILLFVRKSN